jgi:uncharacterized protein YkwD
MSLKQYMKMSKPALIRKIMKTLTAMPKVKLARICYNITKSKLPRLRTIRQKALPRRKTKRKKMTKAEKTKFLARLNKGRIKAGLKPIRAKR